MGNEFSDGQLVENTLTGDKYAFAELVKRHQERIINISYRILRDRQDALDTSQETFLKAYQNLARLKDGNKFSGWLKTIATRQSLNKFIKRKKEPPAIRGLELENNTDLAIMNQYTEERIYKILEICCKLISPEEYESWLAAQAPALQGGAQ